MLHRTRLPLACSCRWRGVEFSLAVEVVDILVVNGDRFLLDVLLAELEFEALLPLELVAVFLERRNLVGLLVRLCLLLAHLLEQRGRRPAFGEAFAWQRNRARGAAIA